MFLHLSGPPYAGLETLAKFLRDEYNFVEGEGSHNEYTYGSGYVDDKRPWVLRIWVEASPQIR